MDNPRAEPATISTKKNIFLETFIWPFLWVILEIYSMSQK